MSSDPRSQDVPSSEQGPAPEAPVPGGDRGRGEEPARANRRESAGEAPSARPADGWTASGRAAAERSEPAQEPVVAIDAEPLTGPADPGEPQGIGRAPDHRVETLPPLADTHRGVPVSARTGEPHRTSALIALQCCLYAAAAASGLGYALYWWRAMHVENFDRAAWIVGWLGPRPGGAGSIALVLVLAVLVVLMAGAPCVAAYQAWGGERLAQRLALAALGVSFLGVLFNPLACAAIPLAAAGAVLARTSGTTEYFDAWEALRAPAPKTEGPGRNVFYGRLPRFQ